MVYVISQLATATAAPVMAFSPLSSCIVDREPPDVLLEIHVLPQQALSGHVP
jgi:hypothetical protein